MYRNLSLCINFSSKYYLYEYMHPFFSKEYCMKFHTINVNIFVWQFGLYIKPVDLVITGFGVVYFYI